METVRVVQATESHGGPFADVMGEIVAMRTTRKPAQPVLPIFQHFNAQTVFFSTEFTSVEVDATVKDNCCSLWL